MTQIIQTGDATIQRRELKLTTVTGMNNQRYRPSCPLACS